VSIVASASDGFTIVALSLPQRNYFAGGHRFWHIGIWLLLFFLFLAMALGISISR